MLKEISLYISLFTIAILCWWITWREIPSQKVAKCPGEEIKRAELDFKSEWERQARND